MQLRNVSKKSETLILMIKIFASPLFSPFSEKNLSHLNYRISKTSMEPSIKEVGKLEGEGSKFVEIYLLLEIKICCRHGGWGYFSLNYQRLLWTVHILDIQKNCTGCNSIFRKIFEFKICKDPMLVVKQMRPQQIALDLSFNLAP